MKRISTRYHGYVDYLLGVLLVLSPWLLGFAGGGAETWTPVLIGSLTVFYSMLTDYELGVVHVIPMKGHLWFDVIGGLFLAASPWLMGYSFVTFVPHLFAGLLLVALAGITEPISTTEPRHFGADLRTTTKW